MKEPTNSTEKSPCLIPYPHSPTPLQKTPSFSIQYESITNSQVLHSNDQIKLSSKNPKFQLSCYLAQTVSVNVNHVTTTLRGIHSKIFYHTNHELPYLILKYMICLIFLISNVCLDCKLPACTDCIISLLVTYITSNLVLCTQYIQTELASLSLHLIL